MIIITSAVDNVNTGITDYIFLLPRPNYCTPIYYKHYIFDKNTTEWGGQHPPLTLSTPLYILNCVRPRIHIYGLYYTQVTKTYKSVLHIIRVNYKGISYHGLLKRTYSLSAKLIESSIPVFSRKSLIMKYVLVYIVYERA
jgi:hypothetical protein